MRLARWDPFKTTLTRWDPAKELEEMTERMNRLVARPAAGVKPKAIEIQVA